jgi:hypothetical protein
VGAERERQLSPHFIQHDSFKYRIFPQSRLFPSTIAHDKLHRPLCDMNQLLVGPASPTYNYAAISPATTESTFAGSPTLVKHEDGSPGSEPAKKKQKRNKPTLSCEECVERKTKVSNISIVRFMAHETCTALHGYTEHMGFLELASLWICIYSFMCCYSKLTLFMISAFGFCPVNLAKLDLELVKKVSNLAS